MPLDTEFTNLPPKKVHQRRGPRAPLPFPVPRGFPRFPGFPEGRPGAPSPPPPQGGMDDGGWSKYDLEYRAYLDELSRYNAQSRQPGEARVDPIEFGGFESLPRFEMGGGESTSPGGGSFSPDFSVEGLTALSNALSSHTSIPSIGLSLMSLLSGPFSPAVFAGKLALQSHVNQQLDKAVARQAELRAITDLDFNDPNLTPADIDIATEAEHGPVEAPAPTSLDLFGGGPGPGPGASASGVPGGEGVSVSGPPGPGGIGTGPAPADPTVGFSVGVGPAPSPTDPSGQPAGAPTGPTASDVSEGAGPGPGPGPGDAPSGTAGPAADATASDASAGGPGPGDGDGDGDGGGDLRYGGYVGGGGGQVHEGEFVVPAGPFAEMLRAVYPTATKYATSARMDPGGLPSLLARLNPFLRDSLLEAVQGPQQPQEGGSSTKRQVRRRSTVEDYD